MKWYLILYAEMHSNDVKYDVIDHYSEQEAVDEFERKMEHERHVNIISVTLHEFKY